MISLFSFLFGCNASSSNLPDISEHSEADWHDLDFTITDYVRETDSSQVFTISGTHNRKIVSIRAILSPAWQFRPKDAQLPLDTYKGIVTFESVGPESDALLLAFSELYGIKASSPTCTKRVQFTGITLAGNPNHALDGELKIKIFYEPDDEKKYAEAYFNILYSTKLAQFHEKDPEYRANIVYAFTKK